MIHKYEQNGYPRLMIINAIDLAQQCRPKKPPDPSQHRVVLPYVKELNPFLCKQFKKVGLQVVNRAMQNLSSCIKPSWSVFQKAVTPASPLSTSRLGGESKNAQTFKSVVYSIPCASCHAIYVGQTKRAL